jgi:hypothetical protein
VSTRLSWRWTRSPGQFSHGPPSSEFLRIPGRTDGPLLRTNVAVVYRIEAKHGYQFCQELILVCKGSGHLFLPEVRSARDALRRGLHGYCVECGARAQGRHRRQISDAVEVGSVQVGPGVISLAAYLQQGGSVLRQGLELRDRYLAGEVSEHCARVVRGFLLRRLDELLSCGFVRSISSLVCSEFRSLESNGCHPRTESGKQMPRILHGRISVDRCHRFFLDLGGPPV